MLFTRFEAVAYGIERRLAMAISGLSLMVARRCVACHFMLEWQHCKGTSLALHFLDKKVEYLISY